MRKIKAGVVGTGFIGVAHVEALRRLGYVDVIAIADSYGVEAKAAGLCVENHFSDYRTMIDSLKLDVIHICTPNNTHHDIAIYALNHGVNVVCEKPFCCTVDEAREMAYAAEKSGLVHTVNFHNRFYPITHQLKQMIANGELGRIYSIHGEYVQDWLFYDTDFNWRLLSEQGGKTRAVADIGSHWMDLAEFVSGRKIKKVFAEFETFHKKRKIPNKPIETFAKVKLEENDYREIEIDTEDICSLIMRFDDGALGTVVISQLFAGAKNCMKINISGSKQSAIWELDDLNNLRIGRRNEPNLVLTKDPNLLCDVSKELVNYPGGHAEGFPDAFKQNFNRIYQYILDRSKPHDFATFEDGLHSMMVNDKIYESAKGRKWVDVE